MQPSIQGQSAVILKAYARAGLPTNETDYIEVTIPNEVSEPVDYANTCRPMAPEQW